MKISKIDKIYYHKPELASGWDFLGIPNPLGIVIFNILGKIEKSRKSRKIQSKKSRKSRKPGDRDRDLKTSKNQEKYREKNPENPGNRHMNLKIP